MPRDTTSRQPNYGARKQLKRALGEAARRIVADAEHIFGSQYKSFRTYPSASPVAGGGSVAVYMTSWRGATPSPTDVRRLVEVAGGRGLHVFVDMLTRVQTNLVSGRSVEHKSLVLTVKWMSGVITDAENAHPEADASSNPLQSTKSGDTYVDHDQHQSPAPPQL